MPRRRITVVRQLSSVECGAACLSMILSYYGRQVTIKECSNELDVGRDGVTGLTIAKAARSHGLRVNAYSLSPADFKFVQLPAIVHWEFNHFVVVERWSPKRIDIIDPAIGRRSLSADEFEAGFTGVVLTFEPGVHFERRRIKRTSFWREYLIKYILHNPGLLGQIIAASILLQLLGLALPILTKVVVDYLLPFRVVSLMPLLVIGIVLLVLTQALTSYLRAVLLMHMQTRLDSKMMLNFFEHLLTLPVRFFQQRTTGDLVMRLGSNSLIREILTGQTLSIVLDGSLVFVYFTIIMIQAPSFGLMVLMIGLVQIGLLLGTTRSMQRLMQRDLAAQAETESYLIEALTRIEAVKSFGAEDRILDHWSNLFFKQLNISLQRNRLSALVDAGMIGLRILSPLLLLWAGSLWVLGGRMSLGTMLALTALGGTTLVPLWSLVTNGQRLQLVGSHFERIGDVLDAEPEQAGQAVNDAPKLTGSIELENISFRYSANTPLILKNISINIKAGQKVALVGRTGSGKTTLGKLLLGFYPPTEGAILYDGIPLQGLKFQSIRNQFGVVFQDSLLFSGSIRQNISLNDPNLSFDQVVEAARLANIHDEIISMPMGYETVVSEMGGGLSGGQYQRLALARALAHQPAILLLDEATSHLDLRTESIVEDNLNELACTRIIISHRLSTIRNADLILVLDQGAIVERGSHQELLAAGGHYADLVGTQLAAEAERPALR